MRLYYFKCRRLLNRSLIINIANEFHHCLFLDDIKNILGEEYDEEELFFEVENEWNIRVSCHSYDYANNERIGDVREEYRSIR